MSITKQLFDQQRSVPETDETGWGNEVTQQLVDLLDGADTILFKSGTVIGLKLPVQTIAVATGGTLTPTYPVYKIQGSGGAASIDIAAGVKDGQVLVLIGQSDTNTITLIHGATSNCQLNGNVTLRANEVLRLVWDATAGDWIEIGRTT